MAVRFIFGFVILIIAFGGEILFKDRVFYEPVPLGISSTDKFADLTQRGC
jgi:hypothetical protein